MHSQKTTTPNSVTLGANYITVVEVRRTQSATEM